MEFGQRFIIAFDGTAMTSDIKEFCRRFAIGGVILFADNYVDPGQLADCVAEIQRDCASGPPLFVASDHEGGRVQRFRDGFTRLPAMADLGDDEPAATADLLDTAARELAACGINLNFAPVADIAPRERDGAIGDRAFSDDPAVASAHVAAAVRAYQRRGLLACAKHFPGHGATAVDSHRALPRVGRTPEAERRELEPFAAAIAAGVAGIMTAHVVFSDDPAGELPATFSSYWIDDVLRRRMGFGGLVFSDALEMTAVRERWAPAEAGRLAICAGTDILVFYLIEEQLRAVHDLCLAASRGAFDGRSGAECLRRIAGAKARLETGRKV